MKKQTGSWMGNEPQPVTSGGDRSVDWLAVVGATATAGVHLVLVAGEPTGTLIAGACLFWTIFAVIRAHQDDNAPRRWGFRADNLRKASVLPAAVFAIAASGLAGYAYVHDTLLLPDHLVLVLLFYPVWGLIQQFLMLSVLVSNLERVGRLKQRRKLIVLLAATLFGLVHAYDLRLAVGSLLLELLLVSLYLRDRNLWPLGVLHGWLGALFYLWVLHRDLFVEYSGQQGTLP